MAQKYQTTPLLQATLSHYQAQRDRCLAELDIVLNKAVGTGNGGNVDSAISLFKELSDADNVIATIQNIIYGNMSSPVEGISVPNSGEPILTAQPAETLQVQ